jgi:hypothetical protein
MTTALRKFVGTEQRLSGDETAVYAAQLEHLHSTTIIIILNILLCTCRTTWTLVLAFQLQRRGAADDCCRRLGSHSDAIHDEIQHQGQSSIRFATRDIKLELCFIQITKWRNPPKALTSI